MPERYDLDQMLAEIKEDEGQEPMAKTGLVSQEDIKKLLQQRLGQKKEGQ